ncbi:hypothetical protein [Streptomyces sp. I05A-00742]|uniref:hypothetical protein n=1 Tax=Streptomyces sp. I05A-00742 TaxID=2732853 RepID=UPI0014888B9E|nr:hypothetical protein [Streptomyces sp. I05A-00742]
MRLVLALGALAVTTTAPAAASAASAAGTKDAERAGAPVAYRMATDALEVHGTPAATDGPPLMPGDRTATDTIAPGGKKYYGVRLDGVSDVYVSAVAAPRPGSALGLRDGIDVSLHRADGTPCGPPRHRSFLSAGGAYPLADHAERRAGTDGPCAAAGTYHFVVTRGDADGGDPAPMPLELKYVTEHPPVTVPSPGNSGPWSSAPPPEPAGPAKDVTGGSGFNDAAEVRTGTWKDTIRPGETRFYRTPVPAGRQLFAKATFGNAPGHTPYVANGVRLGLNDTARGHVANRTDGYQGSPVSVPLAAPPAALGGGPPSGWYYLQVSLNFKAATGRSGAVPVTLAVDTTPARRAPASPPGPPSPQSAAHPAPDRPLRALGYAGIGTGTALLLGLGGWTLLARRPGE